MTAMNLPRLNHKPDYIEDTLARIAAGGFDASAPLSMAVLPANATADARRLFTQQALIADWACYTKPANRFDAPRMARTIENFPQGFRIYCAALGDGTRLPVGYTAWFPIAREVFYRLHDAPQTITHRGQVAVALPTLQSSNNYLYVVNYSVIDSLHKTAHTGVMLRAMAREMRAVPCGGLAAICVSESGVRIAEKFGMKYRGDMTHEGEVEGVYTLQLEERQ
jgi:hypothetical protein